ncbi:hypothetical protein DW1_2301 [Proteiniborus sp. DW1]|uniref:DUF1062 domain-containing protein n=1 Tax=Proteiniborus sp. DW1 TaxID=1889883 RepID=UPI00092DFCF7|nr:DUF1062 domain-containing protein [Proteiniborus sp. DW1]SCG83865.1 hypothetical protein DW1_2301 [Proteiniborus sp. DW1]
MSYLNIIEWEIIPDTTPQVKRNCPKCGDKKHYINSEKFRVNANGSLIDIWLIYQCEKCSSTWNMTIHERIKPNAISKIQYEKFQSNDRDLALHYGLDINIHKKNKVEAIWESVRYNIITREMSQTNEREDEQQYIIRCKYPLQLRADKLLSEKLQVSRSKIRTLYENGAIYTQENKNILKLKAYDGMQIYINNNYIVLNE